MKYRYSLIRRDYTIDYEFDDKKITATYSDSEEEIEDTFDFSDFEEGDKLDGKIKSDIPVKVVKSVENNGELKVALFKPYGREEALELMKTGEMPYSEDWQEVE